MGLLLVRLKILPKDVDVKSSELIDSVKRVLPEDMSVVREGEEPIAFGLVASILDVQVEERDGVMDDLEDSVHSSSLVSQIEVLGVSRMSTRLK